VAVLAVAVLPDDVSPGVNGEGTRAVDVIGVLDVGVLALLKLDGARRGEAKAADPRG